MPKQLTREMVARFKHDGILFPLSAFKPDEVAGKLRRLEEIEASRAGRLPPSMNAKPHLLVPWLWNMVHDPRVVDPVEDLLGPDILCWGTSFITKHPNQSRYVSWHQDATHWGLSAPEAVTAWVALTPSMPENGCVRVVPGTHREQLPHRDTCDPANLLGRREEVLVPVDESKAVDVILAPGEMSLHDVLIIHGSNPNRSSIRRTGFAIRYISGYIRQAAGARNFATLVRGRDHGHFDIEQEPEGEFHPAAVARHSTILRQAMSIVFAPSRAAAAPGSQR